MSQDDVERVANAVLYEGYLLYPYRASAIKNRQRFNFGVLFPEHDPAVTSGSERSMLRTACLIQAPAEATVTARLRFLQLVERPRNEESGAAAYQEATERDVVCSATLGHIGAEPPVHEFTFPAPTGNLSGAIALRSEACRAGVVRVTMQVTNTTAPAGPASTREDALLRAFVSAHTIMSLSAGRFISQIDPGEYADLAAASENVGTWPVLVGDPARQDTMLSAPIILYDYPEIAPESAGDLFDSTEIDEILSLRILTLSDEERAEIRASDERGRLLLERTDALTPEQLMQLHGVLRQPRAEPGVTL